MKTISKKKLDELIAQERQYWETGSHDALAKRLDLARDMEAETNLSMFAILDLLSGILCPRGFAHDAENDEIYSVLRIMGWEATDEEHPAN
jgi:hypothetical protein